MTADPRTPRAVEQRRAIGRRLRALRLALCLTVKQAKDAIGTGKAQLQAIETGNADVMASTLIDIAEVYGLHVAVVADFHLPLLNLTADEIACMVAAAVGWLNADEQRQSSYAGVHLRSALDKLTTSTEEPS